MPNEALMKVGKEAEKEFNRMLLNAGGRTPNYRYYGSWEELFLKRGNRVFCRSTERVNGKWLSWVYVCDGHQKAIVQNMVKHDKRKDAKARALQLWHASKQKVATTKNKVREKEVEMETKLKLNDIELDSSIAIRQGLDEETVERYMDSLEKLPPIVVFNVDGKNLLVDGFHRREAATRKGWGEIKAEVREGSYQDALEYAIYANLKHGKPLSRQEQQQAVRRLKGLHGNWGYRKLANAVGRSQNFAETVLKADEVRGVLINNTLDDSKLEQIQPSPKEHWAKLGELAAEHNWTVVEIREKVRQINLGPTQAEKILAPTVSEAEEVEGEIEAQAETEAQLVKKQTETIKEEKEAKKEVTKITTGQEVEAEAEEIETKGSLIAEAVILSLVQVSDSIADLAEKFKLANVTSEQWDKVQAHLEGIISICFSLISEHDPSRVAEAVEKVEAKVQEYL